MNYSIKIVSLEEAKQTATFQFDEPSRPPAGYELVQASVGESGDVCRLAYKPRSGDPEKNVKVTARSAKDSRVPGHPCGVDEEIMVNDRSGTYAKTDYEIIGSLPAGVSDPAELQDGIVEFISSSGTYYFILGPLEKDEVDTDGRIYMENVCGRTSGVGTIRDYHLIRMDHSHRQNF